MFQHRVKPHEDSIYGRRDGAITGLSVIHQEKGNIYRKSSLWKQGVVDGVQMLPRSGMYKPDVSRLGKHDRLGMSRFHQNVTHPLIFPTLSCLLSGFGCNQSPPAAPWTRTDRCAGTQASRGGKKW